MIHRLKKNILKLLSLNWFLSNIWWKLQETTHTTPDVLVMLTLLLAALVHYVLHTNIQVGCEEIHHAPVRMNRYDSVDCLTFDPVPSSRLHLKIY